MSWRRASEAPSRIFREHYPDEYDGSEPEREVVSAFPESDEGRCRYCGTVVDKAVARKGYCPDCADELEIEQEDKLPASVLTTPLTSGEAA